jgi:hypothetical protein
LIQLEAENGEGDGTVVQRSTASAGSARLLKGGEECTLMLETAGAASYTIEVSYSNDSVGPGEIVRIIVDGTEEGQFEAEATGTSGNETGPGWDAFNSIQLPGITALEPGTHEIRIVVEDGDDLGVEIDAVTFEAAT